jgi:hypothetical protein
MGVGGALVVAFLSVGGWIAFKLLRVVFLICEAVPLVRYALLLGIVAYIFHLYALEGHWGWPWNAWPR